MQTTPSFELLSELRKTASWRTDPLRTPIEHLLEYLLTGSLASKASEDIVRLASRVLNFDIRNIRVVVFGGGTGLSTIIGGNSQMPDWPNKPNIGIKTAFRNIDIVVCTTDDGGSTGQLLKTLPIVGIGDIRKVLLSSILVENLQQKHSVSEKESHHLIRAIHALFNYRFAETPKPDDEILCDPVLLLPPRLRSCCPKSLSDSFRELGTHISHSGKGPALNPSGHSIGNLLLASSIFMEAGGRTDHPPKLQAIQNGIDRIADLIGALTGRIHAATATPGELRFRYDNGVEVYGQSKSARTRRDSPVERVFAEFTEDPAVSQAVQSAINEADLIIYAPGSLYTSIIPILQLEPIVAAIRSNSKALKVLGANSWIQEGETDISLKNQGRGFLVSELIEAYDRNVMSGIDGLFDVVLSANLEHIPVNILRNYAIEGKTPIHLDRQEVETFGLHPIEATLFSREQERKTKVIQHDATRFMMAIRTLLFVDTHLGDKPEFNIRRIIKLALQSASNQKAVSNRGIRQDLLCNYLNAIKTDLQQKKFNPTGLREFLIELIWDNRDIRPAHLKNFRGAVVIKSEEWNRSTEWDNILGYYDPADLFIKLHEELLAAHSRINEDLLVAIGESLLGQYIEKRCWIDYHGARAYEITLRSESERHCFLNDSQLHDYLKLARMTQDSKDPNIYRITINDDEGFLPPGLLFGLMFSWYLNGGGLTMSYEMSLLRWSAKSLMPLHAQDRVRKQNLVSFFRTQVFGHQE